MTRLSSPVLIKTALKSGLLAWTLASTAASAQSIDYSALRQMFGEPVTTSVTGKPQRASEAPASIVIITQDDIRRSASKDIPGLVQAYAGIDVARWTASQSDVSIRGGVQPYNSRLLVLVNGQQVYQDHYGMTNWRGIGVQLADIQQIEVVKGPNSALFGFNAVSGVINIITINPLYTQQLTATAEAGTHGYGNVSASTAFKLGDQFGVRASAGYGRTNELKGLATSPFPPLPGGSALDPKHAEVAGELYGTVAEGTEIVLSANHSYVRQQEFIHILMLGRGYEKFTALGGRISHDTGWGAISAKVYRNKTDIHTPIDLLPADLEYHNTTLVASADAVARVGNANTVRAGVEFRDNSLIDIPGYAGATRYNVYAVNGMWESVLSDSVTGTIAGRVDHLKLSKEGVVDQPGIFTKADFDRAFTTLSINSALLFKLDEVTTLRASGGRGIQSPSLFSFGSRLTLPIPGLPFPAVSAGDPSIRPAVIWSGELSIARQLNDNRARVELTAFYNRTSDIIGSPANSTSPRAAPPAYPFILTTAANVGSFEAYGLEASLRGRTGQYVLWSLNYSWTEAQQDIEGDSGSTFNWPVALDRTTPRHKVKATLSYERGAWLGTVAARYTSRTRQLIYLDPSLRLFDINQSLALDAKVSFKLDANKTIELVGENLTGAAGAGLSPIAAERRLRASLQVRL